MSKSNKPKWSGKETYRNIFLFDAPLDEVDVEELVNMLKEADHAYTNESESFMTDEQYDYVRHFVEITNTKHDYNSVVGSAVRGAAQPLPNKMGSLTQAHEGETIKFVSKYNLHNEDFVLMDKLDGNSGQLCYDEKGQITIGYSRGDGFEGADLTRHILQMKNVPKRLRGYNGGIPVDVRVEFIISPEDFRRYIQPVVMSSSGKPYKNPRNAVAGFLNAERNDPLVYKYIRVVAYQIFNSSDDKITQLDKLSDFDFEIVNYTVVNGKHLTDEFLASELQRRKTESQYELDGVVYEVNAGKLRKQINPTTNTLNPEYARKFKVNQLTTTKVVDVIFAISKTGYLIPRVRVEPVDILGVTVEYPTGHNAGYIRDNRIGPGAIVSITRAGDVTPYIESVISPATNDFDFWFESKLDAFGDWEFTETGVHAFVFADHPEALRKRAIDCFTILDIPLLKDGNVTKLFEAGFDTPVKIITASERDIVNVVGENGKKIYQGLVKKLSAIEEPVLMAASGCFGRGIGVRKLQKAYAAVDGELQKIADVDFFSNHVESIGEKTAELLSHGVSHYEKFKQQVSAYVTIVEKQVSAEGPLMGNVYVFTGFRSPELKQQLCDLGAEVVDSYSKRVTHVIAADPTESSGKIKKARDNGAQIIGKEDIQDQLDTL